MGYFQGGGVNEPTPGKKKYKADPAILVQPRFKEPFYRNYDLYDTEGLSGPPVHGPGSGWNHMDEHNSIQEFLNFRRKRLKGKYVADDFWIEDTDSNRKQRIENMKVRSNLFSRIIKTAQRNYDYGKGLYENMDKYDSVEDFLNGDKNSIDFPVDSQIGEGSIRDTSETYEKPNRLGPGINADSNIFPATVGLGDEESYPYSAQIGGYLDQYLPQDDFEGKPDSELDFGRDYTEETEDPGVLKEEDLERLMKKYLSPKENGLFGLPDGISPPDDIDPSATVNTPNPEYGTTDEGIIMYPADGLSKLR